MGANQIAAPARNVPTERVNGLSVYSTNQTSRWDVSPTDFVRPIGTFGW
jgi:hypothetical protein